MQTFLDAMLIAKGENELTVSDTKPERSTGHRLSDRTSAFTRKNINKKIRGSKSGNLYPLRNGTGPRSV
jgi:hypothetical protein